MYILVYQHTSVLPCCAIFVQCLSTSISYICLIKVRFPLLTVRPIAVSMTWHNILCIRGLYPTTPASHWVRSHSILTVYVDFVLICILHRCISDFSVGGHHDNYYVSDQAAPWDRPGLEISSVKWAGPCRAELIQGYVQSSEFSNT